MGIFTKRYMLALGWEKPTDTFTYTVISAIPNISSIVQSAFLFTHPFNHPFTLPSLILSHKRIYSSLQRQTNKS